MRELTTGERALAHLEPGPGKHAKPLAANQRSAQDAGEQDDGKGGTEPDAILDCGQHQQFDDRHGDEDEGEAHVGQHTRRRYAVPHAAP